MEHIASIDTLTGTSFQTSVAKEDARRILAKITAPAWLILIQAACYFIEATFGRAPILGDAVPCVGLLAAICGINMGLRLSNEGSLARGLNCAAVSMAGLLFWIVQIVVKHLALFS